MLASIALSSLKDHWSKSPSHKDWPKLTFVQESSRGKGKLGEREITGELLHLWEYNADWSPWAVRVNVLVPTWRRSRGSISVNVPTEILILKFAMCSDRSHPTTLISTIIRHSSNPNSSSQLDQDRDKKQMKPQLKRLSQSTCEVEKVPWSAVSITKSGRMFFPRGSSLFCSSLRSKTGDLRPRRIMDMGEELGGDVPIFDVEPWSETILVGFPGQLSVMRLQLH